MLPSALIAAALSLPTQLQAQNTLQLPNGDQLTGLLTNLAKTGEASFRPTGSASVVTLKPGVLKSVEFQPKQETVHPLSSEWMQLSNGDTLPCRIDSMDSETITFDSWFAGKLSIDREFVSRIDFNKDISSKELVKKLAWKKGSNSQWSITKEALSGKGNSSISCTPDLTQNFIIQCSVEWENQHPRFKIYFCSNSEKLHTVKDSYHLECTGNTLDFYRTFPSGLNKKLGSYASNLSRHAKSSLDLKIQVDRTNSQIALVIDGEKKSLFHDIDISPPNGNSLLIHSSLNNFQTLTFKDFQVYNWNDDLIEIDHHISDNQQESDILIDSDKDRLTGYSSKIVMKAAKRQLIFDLSASQQSVPIPFTKIRQLHLKPAHESPAQTTAHYTAALGSSTTLSLNSIQLENGQAKVTHPILGEFTIQRSSFTTLSSNPANQNE